MMKLLTILFILPLIAVAFAPSPITSRRCLLQQRMAVDLAPEPEGGEEMTALSTSANTRMKKMKEMPGLKTIDGAGPAYEFWMTAEADGKLIKEFRAQILKDASKKANFPGFRKGQVPPYAQPQITQFSLSEALIKTIEATVEAYGLVSLAGSDGEVNVHEDVKDISKGYKVGDAVQFTATLNAAFDPEKSAAPEAAVIDVESSTEEAVEEAA